ncbi:MAG: hypothetical protein WBN34_07360, partial [Woeseia sp.]
MSHPAGHASIDAKEPLHGYRRLGRRSPRIEPLTATMSAPAAHRAAIQRRSRSTTPPPQNVYRLYT